MGITWEVGSMVKTLGFCFNVVFSTSLLLVSGSLTSRVAGPLCVPHVAKAEVARPSSDSDLERP